MSSLEINQGARANNSGSNHEKTIFEVLNVFSDYLTNNLTIAKQRISNGLHVILKQPSFTNIYGTEGNQDFFIWLNNSLRIRIECKNQNTPGSVDEKIPFVIENFIKTNLDVCNENILILILEGTHYNTVRGLGIVNYAKNKAMEFNNSQNDKKIYVTVGLTESEDLLLSLYDSHK